MCALTPDLLAALWSTLEESPGSRVLIHVVDAANPRWQQQIAAVDRILAELEFNQIPRLLVFNKTDLVDAGTLSALKRTAACDDNGCVSISALQTQTLRPL